MDPIVDDVFRLSPRFDPANSPDVRGDVVRSALACLALAGVLMYELS
jgi:hypothetical protein